ncbi:hypothetical protein [Aquirufa nivalisilvae]|uniref:hypothetical protein n=2 Tax=Aquirufa nivalisilvae TaxID=2516557 RepID=UPI0022A9C4D0|nr:hypothetical protein [Aquirufa nivalisilvae]
MKRFHQFKLVLCSLLLSTMFQAQAQVGQRIEFPVGGKDLESFTIPIGNQGVIILNQLGKQEFSIQKFSTNLEQVWYTSGTIDNGLDYVNYSFDGKSLNLLFSRFKSNSYQIVRVNVSKGSFEKFQIYSVDRMEISNFKALNESLFIGGIVNNQPVILFTNLKERKTRILPSVVKGQAEIQSMDLDSIQQQVNVTYSVGNRAKNYQLIIKSFDEDGGQIGQIVMNPNEEFAMMNAKSTQLNDSLQVIVGTYGHKTTIGSSKGPSSQGIYFNSYLDGELLQSKFHSFTKFSNFFNFLTPKQKEKQEKKIKDKESKGEDLRLDYRLLIHEIIKKGDHYIVVAEAFYPDYKYNNFGPYGSMMGLGSFYSPWSMMYNPYRWGYGYYGLYSPYSSYYSPWGYRGYNYYGNQQQFDGWVYTHAVIVELDEKGELLWDHCIDMKDLKEPKLIQKIKTSIQGDQIVLSFNLDNQIITKTIKNQGKSESESIQNISTENEGDKIRRSSRSELNYWFGPYFLANGYQTISNEEGRRSVYYLNKIEIQK